MAFIKRSILKLTNSQLDLNLRALRELYPKVSKPERQELRQMIADCAVGGTEFVTRTAGAGGERKKRAVTRKKRAAAPAKRKSAEKKKVAKKKAPKKTTTTEEAK